MKLLYDLFPILIFFAVYKVYGLFAATGVAILIVTIQIMSTLLRGKKPEIMHLITFVMVSVLGGATLLFRNEMFIKWKPTAVYWILGVVFAASQKLSKKNLVQKMLEKTLSLPSKAWPILNTSWYLFFFLMGALNLIVVYWFDTDMWVNFKLFGTLVLTLLFAIIQGALVSRFMPEQQPEQQNK